MPYNRPRRTRPERVQQTRKTARRQGANMPFQGGLGLNQGIQNQPGVGTQQRGQCPAGQQLQRDPRSGVMRCVSAGPESPTIDKPKIRNNGNY